MLSGESEAKSLPYSTHRSPYPIRYSIAYPKELSRRKGVERGIGALIPALIPMGLGYISDTLFAAWHIVLASVITALVITCPLYVAFRISTKGRESFLAEDGKRIEEIAQWALASAAYALFLTDDNPKRSVGCSVRLDIQRGGRINCLRAAVTPILLLPHILILALFGFTFVVIVPVCAVICSAFRRYPGWIFGFTSGYLRWIARTLGYWLSLTDRYPPFSFRADI